MLRRKCPRLIGDHDWAQMVEESYSPRLGRSAEAFQTRQNRTGRAKPERNLEPAGRSPGIENQPERSLENPDARFEFLAASVTESARSCSL